MVLENAETLQTRIKEAMKSAMKAGEKQRLTVIRSMMAGIKQREVDERISLEDRQIISVLDKMVKQRRESLKQYRSAGRDDLADIEEFEIQEIQSFLPAALSSEEIEQIISEVVSQIGATSIRDMGKVMGILKSRMHGRADMSKVSVKVKTFLNEK